MAFYRLRQTLEARELSTFTSIRRESPRTISAGEVIETLSSQSSKGRVLIRYEGSCYRVWKEDLLTLAERLSEGDLNRGAYV